MIKVKTASVIVIPVVVTGILSVTVIGVTNYNNSFGFNLRTRDSGEDGYVLTIDASNRLSGGNVQTPGGTNIHFDEYGVDEDVNGGLLELAAYGSIALQTYISGIERVDVTSEDTEGKEYFLTVGATPNSSEYVTGGYKGYSTINLNSDYSGTCFYFTVQNKTENPIIIQSISIHYSCVDSEAGLKKTIENHLCYPIDNSYNGKPHNPYYGYDIDPSSIPSNRVVVKTMKEDQYPTAPGEYTYGYDVYDVDKNGNARKLLYTRTKVFHIRGENLVPIPDGKKVVTFHIPDENGKEKLICQDVGKVGNYDLTKLPQECLQYSWESPYNSFSYISDSHYYPVFRVTGLSANKEGDGCYPVHLTYSYAERGFTMPNPQMKPGYKFGGWYMDAELTTPFDENKLNPGNLVLYAKCVETDLEMRRVYYHYEDGTLSNRIDYLYSDDEKLTLPEASTFMDLQREMKWPFWEVFCGSTNMGLYKQTTESDQGDKIKYSDFNGHDGDVHIYLTDVKVNPYANWSYDLFSVDGEGNHVYQHTTMASKYARETDFIIPAYAVNSRLDGPHIQADGFTIDRTGQFFMTDEKSNAFVVDGGTLKSIASYGYGNIGIKKPLSGILRHESVKKVSRRAFFNRYGLEGTYFPRNATVFEIEAYANVTFNRVLTLPKGLSRIGDRCFLGAQNIEFVCLPRTIKSIGINAFAYATYNSDLRVFENITNRTVGGNSPIVFLYEGTQQDFNILDDVTKAAITNNASRIVYNYSYGTYYGRG